MASHPSRTSELIAVRQDERLDLVRLEPWLREHVPRTDGVLSVEQFGGGHANLTYLIRFGTHEYVLRRPPLGPVAPSSHDMKREHRVLSRLGEAYPLAPTSYAHCADPTVLGVDFHVMERRHGFVIRGRLPADIRRDPVAVRRLGEMMVDNLAALHLVTPDAVGLGDLGKPAGFIPRQLAGWTSRWIATERRLPPVDTLLAWLHDDPPSPHATTLLHNDYQLENILVDTHDPTVPVAVLDWDMCTRGDPLMDLGYLLSVWVEPTDDPSWRGLSPMPAQEPGCLTRREILDRYARNTGFDVERAHWYHVFGVFKLLVILQQIYVRYLRGQTQDQRFASLGQRVEGLTARGLALVDDRSG